MMTGISASSASCRSAASTDQPSRSGIITSSVITVWQQFLGQLEPLHPAARGGNDGKSFCLEMIRNELARGRIVVDDENAIGAGPAAAIGTDRIPLPASPRCWASGH